ncbi:MAG: hypothetical protein ACJ8C4_14135 [Gemmataceae bacterium]
MEHDKSRKKGDAPLLLAMACGATVEQAARQAGLSDRTIYRRLKDPEFRKELQAVRDDMVRRSAGMLTAAAGEAVKTLAALMSSGVPPATRLGAARAVLEIGIKVREVSELAERVANLEDRLGQNRVA